MRPRVRDVFVPDIAHALSLICRFTGHVDVFYSVAEHSVRLSRVLRANQYPVDDCLWGLLHDASEAYLADIPSPMKRTPAFAFYREAEAKVMACIVSALGLPPNEPECVKQADSLMLETEARDLMPRREADEWPHCHEPAKWVILPWSSKRAEIEFLDTYQMLVAERARITTKE
jgi:hypothetical protein